MRSFRAALLLVGSCGARTELGAPTNDAAVDQYVADHHVDVELDAADVVVIDAPEDVVVHDAGTCTTCSADLNASETPVGDNTVQGAQWLAYEMPIECDRFAAWIAIHDDSAAIRVYIDDGNGAPGAEVLPPTATQPQPQSDGWFIAPANIQLKGGRSYFVATSIKPYYSNVSTHTAWSQSGTITRYWGSFDSNGGNWQGPYQNPPMLRVGDCE